MLHVTKGHCSCICHNPLDTDAIRQNPQCGRRGLFFKCKYSSLKEQAMTRTYSCTLFYLQDAILSAVPEQLLSGKHFLLFNFYFMGKKNYLPGDQKELIYV